MTEFTTEENKKIRWEIEQRLEAYRRKTNPSHEEKITDAFEKWKIDIIREMNALATHGRTERQFKLSISESFSGKDYKELREKLQTHFEDVFTIEPSRDTDFLYWNISFVQAND